MPASREEIRRYVAAALRARDRVSALEGDVVRRVLRDLRESRRRLLDDLATGRGTSFGLAHQASLLRAVEIEIGELERRLSATIRPGVDAVVDRAQELLRRNYRIAGIDPDTVPFQALVNSRALGIAQGDQVALLVRRATGLARDGIQADLRRALAGKLSLEALAKRTLPRLQDPGTFGTLAVRAETIVRTEYGRTLELAGDVHREEVRRAGVRVRKRWLAIRDFRTRPTHRELDGVEVEPDATFDVGGEPARFPMDPALSAEESVNCRCTAVNVVVPPGRE